MSTYTFNPLEHELIHYLNNKITEKDDDPESKHINEVNICHYEPAELPELAKINSSHTWYFISPVEKFGKLNRTKRESRSGYWKITGKNRPVKDVNGNQIGLKKYLVFVENKTSSSSSSSSISTIVPQNRKYTWKIHEFHSLLHHPKKDALVLCKLMKKTSPRGSQEISEDNSVALDPSLTSDPVPINHSQMQTENKSIVEEHNGGDNCDDLEHLLPVFHDNWLDHSRFNDIYWDFLNTLQSGESSSQPLGQRGHVYDPNTTEILKK